MKIKRKIVKISRRSTSTPVKIRAMDTKSHTKLEYALVLERMEGLCSFQRIGEFGAPPAPQQDYRLAKDRCHAPAKPRHLLRETTISRGGARDNRPQTGLASLVVFC
jgi:hypothetical protein